MGRCPAPPSRPTPLDANGASLPPYRNPKHATDKGSDLELFKCVTGVRCLDIIVILTF